LTKTISFHLRYRTCDRRPAEHCLAKDRSLGSTTMTEATIIDNVIPRADVVKRAARLGAEIRNIKLSGDLSDQAIGAINKVLLEHKVIFFRNQGHLDDAEQERFAIRLGKLVPHPTVGAIKGTSSILELDSARGGGRADQWHTDVTFVDAYPKISVLRGVVIPPFGGDTVWSNTAAAYLDLPTPLQRLADELWAVHSNAYDYAVKSRASEADKKHFDEIFTGTVYETEHPVVRVHPETGERTLVLGNFVQRFVGLPKYDGQKLFELFQSHITAPENTVRWNWQAGDVAIWDNRATQHYAVNDYGDQHRIVRRATIDGDVPVSIDGRRSVTRIKSTKPQTAKAA
jgi:alpha-ketoglutarate-dependent sulfate ester dioxygenase